MKVPKYVPLPQNLLQLSFTQLIEKTSRKVNFMNNFIDILYFKKSSSALYSVSKLNAKLSHSTTWNYTLVHSTLFFSGLDGAVTFPDNEKVRIKHVY